MKIVFYHPPKSHKYSSTWCFFLKYRSRKSDIAKLFLNLTSTQARIMPFERFEDKSRNLKIKYI